MKIEDVALGTCESVGSVGLRLTTTPHRNGEITQELDSYAGEVTRAMSRWVFDTREQGVRDALVQLGWTPPNDQVERTQKADKGEQEQPETQPSEVRSDALLDSILDAIRTTPQIRKTYFCHGEPHSDYYTDYTVLRTRIGALLSNCR